MQSNADAIKNAGILAELVYKDKYFQTTNRDTVIDQNDNSQLLTTYTVRATHSELLVDDFSEEFGFQAMLLMDSSNNYVIAFRGTEGDNPGN